MSGSRSGHALIFRVTPASSFFWGGGRTCGMVAWMWRGHVRVRPSPPPLIPPPHPFVYRSLYEPHLAPFVSQKLTNAHARTSSVCCCLGCLTRAGLTHLCPPPTPPTHTHRKKGAWPGDSDARTRPLRGICARKSLLMNSHSNMMSVTEHGYLIKT